MVDYEGRESRAFIYHPVSNLNLLFSDKDFMNHYFWRDLPLSPQETPPYAFKHCVASCNRSRLEAACV